MLFLLVTALSVAALMAAFEFTKFGEQSGAPSINEPSVQSASNTCGTPEALIGSWRDVDDPTYTLQFDSSGAYAEKHDDVVAVFNAGTKAFTYDRPTATATGHWSLVGDTQKELRDWSLAYSNVPPPPLPANSRILREDFGDGPWYFALTFEDNCRRVIQAATWMDEDDGTEYQRIQGI
jgi:hypothetical protein